MLPPASSSKVLSVVGSQASDRAEVGMGESRRSSIDLDGFAEVRPESETAGVPAAGRVVEQGDDDSKVTSAAAVEQWNGSPDNGVGRLRLHDVKKF